MTRGVSRLSWLGLLKKRSFAFGFGPYFEVFSLSEVVRAR